MIFNSFAGAAGVVLVAALSPGPNNVVVLRAAAAGDGSRAWPAIGGVVCGGIAMLAGTIAAGSAVLTTPHFRLGVAIAGATYLAWLGLTMMRGSASPGKDSPLPAGFYGVFVFQFLNPQKLGDGSIPRCRISTNGWGNDVCLAGAHLCGDSHRMPALVGGSRSSSCRDSAHT